MQDGHFADTAHPLAAPPSLAARISPQVFAAAVFLALFATTLVAILWANGGAMIYALDDPYIHLALAQGIAAGHYGINPGEVTSPSSSVIWPFLLLPLAGTTLHAHVPLAINLVCGLIAALLCGRCVAAMPIAAGGSESAIVRLVVAGLLVVAFNIVGLAFTGMEHSLQLVLAVAAAVGLTEMWCGRRLPIWALAAAAIAPAVRYEMLAITAAVAVALAGERRWRDAAALLAVSILLPVALAVFLVAHGNSPLPNSVLIKLNLSKPASEGTSLIAGLLPQRWWANLPQKALMLAILALLALWWRTSSGSRRWVLGAAALAVLLHLGLGRFGWFYRYEIYALAFSGLIVLWQLAERAPRYLILGCIVPAVLYVWSIVNTPAASRNIYEQPYQMARFVAEHYRKPVAVNDLGLVSYMRDRDVYVLDLWGLASNEAARLSRAGRTAQWLDGVTRRHQVGLAMIFEHWFDQIPDSWTRVGTLRLAGRRVIVAADEVAIYATGAGDAREIADHLRAFRPKLPAGVTLDFAAPR